MSNRTLSRKECLDLDVATYNMAMELTWKTEKVKKGLSGDLDVCEHCHRKYSICCICDAAEKRWEDMIQEIKDVSERDRTGE